jgi:hypothetical protein
MKKTFHDIFDQRKLLKTRATKVTIEKRNFDEISLEKGVTQTLMRRIRRYSQFKTTDLAKNI